MKPLDGNLRSRTLATLYPAQTADGSPIPDGVSMPRSEETADYKQWLIPEFEQMVVEGSRLPSFRFMTETVGGRTPVWAGLPDRLAVTRS